MLLDKTETQICESKSVLSFETEGGGQWKVWDRYIAIEGKKAFHIGNICGTCSFFFERLPSLVYPGSKEDYFIYEQVELWGVDAFWGLPHFPKTEYYRLTSKEFVAGLGLFEFLIPTFPHNWLDTERINYYVQLLNSGSKPTAISLSVLDIKQPADWEGDKRITEHWCLAHYLIDGHHKAFAAASVGQPLTLISFLATEQGISRPEDVERVVNIL